MPDAGEVATSRVDVAPARIAIDVREWHSGTSTGIARILDSFVGWAATHSEHTLVLCGDQKSEPRADGDRLEFHVTDAGNTLMWDQIHLPRLLARTRADVLFSPYYKGPVRAPCPVVVTVHDLFDLHHPARHSKVRRKLFAAWMKLIAWRASRVLTLSEYSRNDIVETLGIPTERIGVIRPAFDERFMSPVPEQRMLEARTTYGLPPDYVLYTGRGAPHKNVETLVAAWAALPDRLRDRCPLVLAGGDIERFRASAARHSADVLTPGFIDDELLPAVYRGATAFCFPSLFEGFGLPPLEAMACGVPVLASNATSLPEVLDDAAVLIDPLDRGAWTDNLARILENQDQRRDLAARGKARAALFRREATGPHMLGEVESAFAARDLGDGRTP